MNKLVRYNLYVLGFVFSFLLNINSQEDTGYNKKQTFAIIIGVSEYPNLSKSQQLDYADNDAELILDYFINKGNVNQNNIYSFINEKANSKDEIGQELYNILLKEAGIDPSKANDQLASKLCKILGVEAVISGSFETNKPMSGAAAVGLAVLGIGGATQNATINLDITHKDDELVVNYLKNIKGGIGSSTDDLINVLMRKTARRIPYTK